MTPKIKLGNLVLIIDQPLKKYKFKFLIFKNYFKVSDRISGYYHNAVTPFLFNEVIPVIISDKIEKLSPQFFWLGGGHTDLKISKKIFKIL